MGASTSANRYESLFEGRRQTLFGQIQCERSKQSDDFGERLFVAFVSIVVEVVSTGIEMKVSREATMTVISMSTAQISLLGELHLASTTSATPTAITIATAPISLTGSGRCPQEQVNPPQAFPSRALHGSPQRQDCSRCEFAGRERLAPAQRLGCVGVWKDGWF
jgi:hypothetical protein